MKYIKHVKRYIHSFYTASSIEPIHYLLNTNLNEIDINNFTECRELLLHRSNSITIIQFVAIAIYLIGEIIWSICILRLFLSRILVLSMSFDKMKSRIEERKLKRKGSKSTVVSTQNTNTDNDSNVHIELSNSGSNTVTTTKINISTSPTNDGDNGRIKRSDTLNEQMEAKNNELFLNLAIKTTNLIILVVVSNYLVLFKFGIQISTSLLNIDAVCNTLAIYLSYQFSTRYYDQLFKACHNVCYGCCVRLCYCCCLPNQLPDHLKLEEIQSDQSNNIELETKS